MNKPQYCPECGAGRNDDGTYRLPKGYPLHRECKTCDSLSTLAFEKMGERIAEDIEKRILEGK